MWGKYCCHCCLCDDQQDPCWLLLTLKDKTGRPWGKEAQNLAQFWQFPLASSWGDTAEGSDLIQQYLGVWSDFIFHYIGTAVRFCWETLHSGARGSRVQPCCCFSEHSSAGESQHPQSPGWGILPSETPLGDRAGEEPPAHPPLCCEKVAVKTGALSSLQQVEQCLADPASQENEGVDVEVTQLRGARSAAEAEILLSLEHSHYGF